MEIQGWFRLSCIPITDILILMFIVLIILLPLLHHTHLLFMDGVDQFGAIFDQNLNFLLDHEQAWSSSRVWSSTHKIARLINRTYVYVGSANMDLAFSDPLHEIRTVSSIGVIFNDVGHRHAETMRQQLEDIFLRDWKSRYASFLDEIYSGSERA